MVLNEAENLFQWQNKLEYNPFQMKEDASMDYTFRCLAH